MLSNFANFYHNLDKKYKVIIWVGIIDIFIILTIALLFFIYRLNNEPNNISITNWDDYASEVPEDYYRLVQETITGTLTNYNNISIDDHYDAVIRDHSYMDTKDQKNNTITNISFLVDIADLQQSYQIEFSYDSNGQVRSSHILISCPSFTYVIYPDSKCRTSSDPYTTLDAHYLPYEGNLPQSDTDFSIRKQTYGSTGTHPGTQYLAVTVNSCDNFDLIQEAKDYIPTWLKERYLDPADFYYEVFNSCNRNTML